MTLQCFGLCEKFGAGPSLARGCWLLLQLCQACLGLLFQCSFFPSTAMFSPLVFDVFISVNNCHLPFLFSRNWSLVFYLFFSLFTKSFEKTRWHSARFQGAFISPICGLGRQRAIAFHLYLSPQLILWELFLPL